MIDRTIELLGLGFVETPHRFGLTITLHVYKVEPVVNNPDSFGGLVERVDQILVTFGRVSLVDERRVPLVNRDDGLCSYNLCPA